MKNLLARAVSQLRTLDGGRQQITLACRRPTFRPDLETLEGRSLLSTFTVSNLADSGPGSLRQAILGSNAAKGMVNVIKFAIPGTGLKTIDLNSPLPAITNHVTINVDPQPGFVTMLRIVIAGQGDPHSGLYSLKVPRAGRPHPMHGVGADLPVRGIIISPLGEVAGSATDLITTSGLVSTPAGPGAVEVDTAATSGSSAPLGSALLASFAPGQSSGFGQSLPSDNGGDSGAGAGMTDARPLADPVATTGSDGPANEVAPWAPFAAGLEEGWQDLKARLTKPDRSTPSTPTGASGAVAGDPGLQTQAPVSSTGRGLESPGDTSPSADTAANRPGLRHVAVGMDPLNFTNLKPSAAIVDAALVDLDMTMDGPHVALGAEPAAVVDRTEMETSRVMAIAAASLTLSTTLERTIGVARGFRAGRNRLVDRSRNDDDDRLPE